MNKQEILEEFKNIMGISEEIDYDTDLGSFDEWDSISKISTAAFLKQKLNLSFKVEDLNKIKNVGELLELVNINE